LDAPLFFGGIFGVTQVRVNAGSVASLFPVDGGTGTVGACWRPIFLPDTFFDAGGRIHYAGDPARAPLSRLPNQRGDYYRSRFAVGARFTEPFKDGAATPASPVTGLHDTQDLSEVGVQTLMGVMNVAFTSRQFFIPKLDTLTKTAAFDPSVRNFANVGYCGRIRVHDPLNPTKGYEIPVYRRSETATYDDLKSGLDALYSRTVSLDPINTQLKSDYRYITSSTYPDPNSHAAIIPVLLFDPFVLNNDPDQITMLKVTNFGLFFLDRVAQTTDADGNRIVTIEGLFVREIMTGGTPISLVNFSPNDLGDSFRRRWLPMSAQLMR
jgi:hypothetical protein